MILKLKKLWCLPVFTRSGMKLGKIADADFDAESQAVIKYRVDAGVFSDKQYLIDRSQILEISDTKMIVEDSVLRVTAIVKPEQASPQTALGTMAQSTIDRE